MYRKSRRKKLDKRGSLLDLIFIAGAVTVFAIAVLIGFKVTNEFNSHIATNADIPDRAKTAGTTLENYYPGLMDNVIVFLLIGLTIVAFVLAALVRIHPVFIALFFIAWIFIIFLCGIYSNVYQEIAADPELSALATQLTFTQHIMTYLPFIVGILGIVLMIVMYKTWNNV